MGGKLLQGVDRDTLKFAFKCSAIRIAGEWLPVYKDPVTDPGKASKQGILTVQQTQTGFVTTGCLDPRVQPGDQLVTVFENGDMVTEYTLADIRQRALEQK